MGRDPLVGRDSLFPPFRCSELGEGTGLGPASLGDLLDQTLHALADRVLGIESDGGGELPEGLDLAATEAIGNLVLDLLLVSVAGFGVAGVAMASLAAETVAAAAGIVLLARYLSRNGVPVPRSMLLDPRAFGALLATTLAPVASAWIREAAWPSSN